MGAPSGKKCAIDDFSEYLKDEINILIHIGRPIHSVIIKCLEEDNEYGTIPMKLIVIIIVNRILIIADMPFRFLELVRNSCSIINSVSGIHNISFRCCDFHILACVIMIRAVFINTNNVAGGVIKLNDAGSKIEKISLIIKIWCKPFNTLKVFSLYNLKSYFSISLSHTTIMVGLTKKYIKYIIVASCPIIIYGISTGRPPIHVRIAHVDTRNQNII